MFSKLALLSLATLALADSESFGLIIIRSGSNYQNSAVVLNAENQFAARGTENYVNAVVTDEGTLKIGTNSFAKVETGAIVASTSGSTGWAIEDNRLTYEGSSGYAIDDSTYLLTPGGNNAQYVIAAFLPDGNRAKDFKPSGAKPNHTNTTVTTHSAPPATHSSTTATFHTQTKNAANALKGVGFGAAVAAGAALLI